MTNLTEKLCTLTQKTVLIPYLVGPHGAGKTSFVREWAKSQGKTCITLNLSAIDAVELTGIPATADGIMTYSRPFFYNYDVLFLDEINRVTDSSVKSALLSLLIDRSINGHKYAGVIIAAGNEGEDYEICELDPAFSDRLVKIKFTPNLNFLPEKFREFVKENNLLEKFSLRRLTEASKVLDDNDLVGLILDKLTAAGWREYKKDGQEKSIKELFKKRMPNLGTLDKSKIVVAFGSYTGKLNQHMKQFLLDITAEQWVALFKEAERVQNYEIIKKLNALVKELGEEKVKIIVESLELSIRG